MASFAKTLIPLTLKYTIMKLSVKRVLLHFLFILLLISCFQAVIFLFPVREGDLFNPVRLLAVFLMCGIALLHTAVFNHFLLRMKKWMIYLSIAFLLLIAGIG